MYQLDGTGQGALNVRVVLRGADWFAGASLITGMRGDDGGPQGGDGVLRDLRQPRDQLAQCHYLVLRAFSAGKSVQPAQAGKVEENLGGGGGSIQVGLYPGGGQWRLVTRRLRTRVLVTRVRDSLLKLFVLPDGVLDRPILDLDGHTLTPCQQFSLPGVHRFTPLARFYTIFAAARPVLYGLCC